jgi:hypothetical protein
MGELLQVLRRNMGISFVFVLGTGCVAGLLRHRTQGEMCYLCNAIALVCVVLALILAPFWIRVAILALILGEQLLRVSQNSLTVEQHYFVEEPSVQPQDRPLQDTSAIEDTVQEPQFRYRGVSYVPSQVHTAKP